MISVMDAKFCAILVLRLALKVREDECLFVLVIVNRKVVLKID